MRVAFFSPLPPQRSGIADYSEELLPHLAERLEIDCFTDAPGPAREVSRLDLPIRAVDEWESRRESFDLAVYHVGNNVEYHAGIYSEALRNPGVVVLHEYMLHHLVQGLTLARGDGPGYVEEMRYAYGRTGERLARRFVDTGLPVDPWRYPLFERLVDRSLALLVHNETTRRRVLASRPDTIVARVPHHLALDALPDESVATARERLGLPEAAFVVASFGFMTPHKRLDVSLRAFAELRRRVPGAVYVLAGEVSPHFDLDALLDDGLGEGVIRTGRLSLADLLAAMAACDVAVNLRHPSGGETSGTLMRLLGMGKAVIVSDHGSFAEVPDGCCAKVPLDAGELGYLTELLTALADDAGLREAVGRNARRHMAEHHTLESSAREYVGFLHQVAAGAPQPFVAVPPLSRAPLSRRGELLAEVGSCVADLGLMDDDGEALETIGSRLVELGLGAAWPPSGDPRSRAR